MTRPTRPKRPRRDGVIEHPPEDVASDEASALGALLFFGFGVGFTLGCVGVMPAIGRTSALLRPEGLRPTRGKSRARGTCLDTRPIDFHRLPQRQRSGFWQGVVPDHG